MSFETNTALLASAALICGSVAMAQKPAEKASSPTAPAGAELADGLAQRLSQGLHVKTVVGEPIKGGAVMLIPILRVDVNFAGGAMPTPAAGAPGASGFLMSGEARPLGFVAITKNGTGSSASRKRRPSEVTKMRMISGCLSAVAYAVCRTAGGHAQPLAKPLADFDKMVSELNSSGVVGEPIRSGDTTVIPFARVRFGLGSADAKGV